jgi:hypothetical protein
MEDMIGIKLIASLLVGVLVGATTLWAAVHLYNRLASSDGQLVVPEPSPRKAIGITILLILLSCGIQLVLECFSPGADLHKISDQIPMHLASAMISFLGSVILVSLFLPTTPRRAILVVLLQVAMEIVIVFVLLGAIAAIYALKQ